jgi:hypothetical protein
MPRMSRILHGRQPPPAASQQARRTGYPVSLCGVPPVCFRGVENNHFGSGGLSL